jgi:transposase InsO family protein
MAGSTSSFNARLWDELLVLLDGEIFYWLAEAKIVIESWRRHYNTVRPHGSLGYKPAGHGGLRAGHGRAGSFATPSSFAARAGVETVYAVTIQPDH